MQVHLYMCITKTNDKIGKTNLRGGGIFVQKCFNSFETILLFPKSWSSKIKIPPLLYPKPNKTIIGK